MKESEVNISYPEIAIDDSKDSREIIKVIPGETGSGIFQTIKEAIDNAKSGTVIQIANGNYCESLVVSTPDLVIEAMEDNKKVYILSSKNPCLKVNLSPDDQLHISGLKFVFRGPNKEGTFSQKVHMNYEKVGNRNCISEFKLQEHMK